MTSFARLAAATALLAAGVATAAAAQDFTTFGRVGQWQIAVNPKMGPGCVAVRRFVNPISQVQMGIDATQATPTGYLAIYVRHTERVQQGEEIPATFDLDGRIFPATFRGQQVEGYGGAFAPVTDDDLIYDVANHDTLTINWGEGNRVLVPLQDADEAIAMLRTCQAAQ
jgi:hypothetical protein